MTTQYTSINQLWFIINLIRICNSKYTAFLYVQRLRLSLVVIIETHRDSNIHYSIGLCDVGVCDVFVLEYDCVRHSFGIGILDLSDVCTVVVWWVVEVPDVDCVVFPGCAYVGISVYEYGASHWAKGHYVAVKWSKHRRIGRYGGGCIGLSQQV